MRLPRVRFTVRGLTIAVAVAALILYASLLAVLSHRSRNLALHYGDQFTVYARGVEIYSDEVSETETSIAVREQNAAESERRAAESTGDLKGEFLRLASSHQESASNERKVLAYQKANLAHYSAMQDYYKLMERKCRYEATHPWLPFAPDPPEPD